MKFLLVTTLLLGCKPMEEKRDFPTLSSYHGKTIKNIWLQDNNDLILYFEGGDSLHIHCYKYPLKLNGVSAYGMIKR